MNQFKNELMNNKFVCSECPKCKKLVWPPSNFCNNCFGNVIWRQVSRNGKLVEFSKKDNVIFCIAEFENVIRVMGELEIGIKKPQIGQDLELIKCNYDGKE
ncbi:MAG TPA: zinc ribbon domain-containing protein, partial [Nitrosopumilaceae archaeon]|nr:zinc ribbon domain-containing protein [Nitrosopumilaceae archaeon]